MKTKKSFLQKTIIATLITIILFSITMPNLVLALRVEWDGSSWSAYFDPGDAKDSKMDSKDWKASDYQINIGGLDKNAYNYEYMKSNAEAWNNALASWEGKTTLIDALQKANDGSVNHASDTADEGNGKDADGDGNTGGTEGVTYDDDDTGLGGVLLDPILDFFVSIGDVVINALQWCVDSSILDSDKNVEKADEKKFSIGQYLMDSDKYKAPAKSVGTGPVKHSENFQITVDVDRFNKGWLNLRGTYYVPVAIYSPEEIFSNNVPLLDVNFFKSDYKNETLQSTIAGWYNALRNLAIVGLLSVLVYVGIRMIISSTAGDKAKYKQMLFDWLIALCLLFFMHYIMSFTITMVDTIVSAIGGERDSVTIQEENGDVGSFDTNLIGAARFQTQYKDVGKKVTYLIMYLALIIYTVIFTWFYLKRLLMMAFLTMIAPLVALTYPIDKIGDGSAQAFNSWLKEYVYNALIQPFHLIIYYVFVGSAMNLAATNPIYMIVALGFILTAEKILRGFFGFNKAGAGTLGSIVAGGAIGSYLGKSIKALAGGSDKGKKGTGSGSSASGDKPIRYEKGYGVNDIEAPDNLADYGKELPSSTASAEDYKPIEDSNSEMSRLEKELEGKDYNDIYMNPELGAKQRRLQELEEQQRRAMLEQAQQEQKQAEEKAKELTVKDKLGNVARYYGGNLGRGAKNLAIKGVKALPRTAFAAGAGTLAAAVAAASGGGLAGALAAGTTFASIGSGAGDKVVKTLENMADERARFEDIKNGNNDATAALRTRRLQWNDDNRKYVRDMLAKEGNGKVPGIREINNRMKEYEPFLQEGFSMKEAEKGRKLAENRDISTDQVAKIMAIGKQKNIDASILNKESDREQYMENMRQEFRKNNSESYANAMTDYTFSVLEDYYGVTPKQANRRARAQKDADKKAKSAKNRSAYNSQTKQTGPRGGSNTPNSNSKLPRGI